MQSNLDFARAVGSNNLEDLKFFPLENKAQSSVRIPKELAQEVMKKHRSTLYGYFQGPRLPFPMVQKYVKSMWGKFGFSEAMLNNNGVFFFQV